jgi:hypothetical protein
MTALRGHDAVIRNSWRARALRQIAKRRSSFATGFRRTGCQRADGRKKCRLFPKVASAPDRRKGGGVGPRIGRFLAASGGESLSWERSHARPDVGSTFRAVCSRCAQIKLASALIKTVQYTPGPSVCTQVATRAGTVGHRVDHGFRRLAEGPLRISRGKYPGTRCAA